MPLSTSLAPKEAVLVNAGHGEVEKGYPFLSVFWTSGEGGAWAAPGGIAADLDISTLHSDRFDSFEDGVEDLGVALGHGRAEYVIVVLGAGTFARRRQRHCQEAEDEQAQEPRLHGSTE